MKKIVVVMVFAMVAGCASLDSGMVTSKHHDMWDYVVYARYNTNTGEIERDQAKVRRTDYANYHLGDCVIVTKNGVKKIDSEAERKRITHGIE